MSATPLPELQARLGALEAERYAGAAGSTEAATLASAAGDCEYLLALIRCLEARPADDTAWISPEARSAPAQALQRIKVLCSQFPDLFNAMFAIAATHQSVSRDILALAIKQFRRDTENLSKEDLMGLLTSLSNGSQQAFEAVLRTRKGAERKAASLPWGKDE